MKKPFSIALAFALAAAAARAGGTLRSVAEINAFNEDATPRAAPFELTGRVLSAVRLSETEEIILADDSGERLEFYRPADLPQPAPGDTVRADGIARMSAEHEPYSRIEDLRVLARGTPPEPVPVRLSEANARVHHLMTIRTEGLVVDAFPDEIDRRFMILILKDADAVMPVTFPVDAFGARRDLVDARIRVTGIYRRAVGGLRKYAWPNITLRAPEDIEVVTPPPSDPFSVPPLEERLYLTAEEIARMSKRAVVGEVLATWSDDRAMLRTDRGRVVNLQLAHGERLPPCGETVVAAGQPETDLFRINLAAARWKPSDRKVRPPADEAPAGTDTAFWNDGARRSLNGLVHGRLLRARGIIRTLPSPDDADFRFALDTGEMTIPVDASSNRGACDGLEIGCRVQVTGRCILRTGSGPQSYSSARVNGLALVIRTPDDIVVLQRPPWWTPGRLTLVISALLAALVGIYIWNRVLRGLVNRRGRELYREQVAHAIAEFKTEERTRLAVELHDSLSQTLSGVACHLAVGAEAFATNPGAARVYLATARKMLNACRTELRQCLFDLRSDTLEEPDFAAAIRKSLDQLESSVRITLRFNVPRRRLKDTTAHAILAIIRELTGNAIRHGGATEVRIAGCIEDGRILFSVRDNGGGFDPSNCDGPLQGHFGLEGIRNRLEKLNGTLTLESRPGDGAKAVVSIPLPAARKQEIRKP